MTNTASETIDVPLKYLANDEDLAVYIASVGGGDMTEHQGNYIMQSVAVQNGRARTEPFRLDREGFTLVYSESDVDDFYDDRQIRDRYETEVKELVHGATGARRIEIFDHTRRSASLDVQKERLIREPASIIHNDYTAGSGPKRLRDHYPDASEQVDQLLERRFAIVNVWRSIGGTVYNSPLTLCDATTTDAADLIAVARKGQDRMGEIQLALYNPDHRWYYFSQMRADEALLFKTYDSATDGRARFTIHTSFDDPSAPEDAPARESLETRCFVFF